MPTWDLYQRMLQTKAEDLHKIRKAIESRYKEHEHSELRELDKEEHASD